MTPQSKIKVYTYTRVSTAMQIEGYSLDAQKNRMKAFAEFNNYEIIHEYEDAGKSGKSRFLIKPVKSAVTMLPDANTELPYEGGKEMLLVEDVDNRELLHNLLHTMYEELPAVKK